MNFYQPEKYLPIVNKIYVGLSLRISRAIPSASVDHVGSSAIQGAISKGDLDVLVRVSKAEFNEALGKIKSLGFTEKEGTFKSKSLCMLVTEQYNWDVAVQLVERGSKFEMFLKFRDRLNEDSTLVEEYNKLKMSSVGLSPDDYRKQKSKFIERVLSI